MPSWSEPPKVSPRCVPPRPPHGPQQHAASCGRAARPARPQAARPPARRQRPRSRRLRRRLRPSDGVSPTRGRPPLPLIHPQRRRAGWWATGSWARTSGRGRLRWCGARRTWPPAPRRQSRRLISAGSTPSCGSRSRARCPSSSACGTPTSCSCTRCSRSVAEAGGDWSGSCVHGALHVGTGLQAAGG